MTPDHILAIAQRHTAYADSTLVIRGQQDILAFVEDLMPGYIDSLRVEAPIEADADERAGFPLHPNAGLDGGMVVIQATSLTEYKRYMSLITKCQEKHGTAQVSQTIKDVCGPVVDIPEESLAPLSWAFDRLLSLDVLPDHFHRFAFSRINPADLLYTGVSSRERGKITLPNYNHALVEKAIAVRDKHSPAQVKQTIRDVCGEEHKIACIPYEFHRKLEWAFDRLMSSAYDPDHLHRFVYLVVSDFSGPVYYKGTTPR